MVMITYTGAMCCWLTTNRQDQSQTKTGRCLLAWLPLIFQTMLAVHFPKTEWKDWGIFLPSSEMMEQSWVDSHFISETLVLPNLTLGLPTWQGRLGVSQNRQDLVKWNRKFVVYSSLLHLPQTGGGLLVRVCLSLCTQMCIRTRYVCISAGEYV